MAFVIREARSDERERVAQFHIPIHFQFSVRTPEQRKAQEDDLETDYPHLCFDEIWNDTYTLIMETQQGQLIGIISLSKNKIQGDCYHKLYSFSICEEHRGTGLGRQLLEKIFEFAKQNDVKSIRLDTLDGWMDTAIALYEKNGFTKFSSFRSEHYLVWTMEKIF